MTTSRADASNAPRARGRGRTALLIIDMINTFEFEGGSALAKQASRAVPQIVKEKNLPPKVLIVHRWTRDMVTNAREIRPVPNVQVVMDMDGWGPPWLKFDTYHDFIKSEPVQFTGFKLFFAHDTEKGHPLLTPEEVLRLTPQPLYIQYQ